jgi:hypothetical protein
MSRKEDYFFSKRKKDFKALFSLFNSAIISFEKGQLSVYEKIKRLKKKSSKHRFWKDMEKRYEVR